MIGTRSARITSASKRTVVVYALLAAALLGSASGASAQTGRPALQYTAATGYGNGGFPVLGWSFTTTQAVTVSALTAQNPHLGSSVRLYDGLGNVLASAVVTTSDPPNGTPVAFRAHAITPILLAANTTYYIVQEAAAFGFGGQATGVTTIPAITFGAMIASATPGANPTTDELFGLTYNPGAFGPSFETPTPAITKNFGLPTIDVGSTTSLTFVLTNPDPFLAMSGIGFTDTLPGGLVVASPNGLTGSCGGGIIGAVDGSSAVSLAGATLTAGASCTFSVNVTGTTPGAKANSVTVTSTSAGTGNTATASLTVLGGVTVTPTAGLVTTEGGGTATFTVVLTGQPTASVLFGLSSSNTAEGTVSVPALTFTAANWNLPQTVTITGVDEFVDDGNIAYSIVTAAATSADPYFSGLNPSDVSATNTDNDSAAITVSSTSGLTTTEAGGIATFSVVLASQPTASVVVGLSSSNTAEGTVSVPALTFMAADWNLPQTVTITGVDEFVDDGNIAYTIVTAAATSIDPNYSGLNPADVAVTNTDNDTAGVTVSPTAGLVTTEGGGTATFTVVLTAQPTANVTIGVSSGDTTEGSVAPGLLTFTPAGWNLPQTVTVTGLPDALTDGDVLFTVLTSTTTSTDAAFHNLAVADVTVTNTEGALPSLSLSKTSSALSFAQVGDVLPYTMVATNTGNVPLSGVVITDPLLPTLTCTPTQPATLNPGQTLTCSGSYTVTATDVAAGQVTNVAETSGQTNDGSLAVNPLVAQPEALVTVTAQGTVTVPGIAPGVGSTRLALTACTIELQQDWTPRYTKLQFEVWNEDEVKFTGAFECSDSWHETDFGQSIDAAQQNFTIGVLGTYGARYRVQAVTSTQCPGAQATGLLGIQSMTIGAGQKTIGTTLVGAGKFTGSIRWDPSGAVLEGGVR